MYATNVIMRNATAGLTTVLRSLSHGNESQTEKATHATEKVWARTNFTQIGTYTRAGTCATSASRTGRMPDPAQLRNA